MKVMVICSQSGYGDHKNEFMRLKKLVSDYPGVTLVKAGGEQSNIKYRHYERVKRSIFESDAIIIDNTHESFRLGYEAALAVQRKKPVLVLSKKRDISTLIKHPYMFGARYTHTTLPVVIREFLELVDKKSLSIRFNMFISKDHYHHIDMMAKKERVTKSEFIRRLVDDNKRMKHQ